MTNSVERVRGEGLASRLASFYLENRFYKEYFSTAPVLTYVGAPHSLNLGDVLLFKACQKLFPLISLIPTTPQSTIRNELVLGMVHGLGQLLFKGFRSTRGVMLGGGTLMNDPFFFPLLERYYRPDCPFFVFGAGVVDLDFLKDNLPHECEMYRKADFIGVRDPYAQQCLQVHDIESVVIGDLVLSVCEPAERVIGEKVIGLNVGADKAPLHGKQEIINAKVGELAHRLLSAGHRVEFFAMRDHDAEYIGSIRREFDLEEVPFWSDYGNYKAFLNKMSEFDLVIGQRLHAVVVGCGTGIPSISLSYRPKCLHFMESLGMKRYVLRTDELDVDAILDMVDEITADYDGIHKRLRSATKGFRELQQFHADKIMNALLECH